MNFKKSLILLSMLFPSMVFAQDTLFCSDSEVRSMIETARQADLNSAKKNEMDNRGYQSVRTNIEVNSEGGRSRNDDNCLANTVPELREMLRENKETIISAYGAMKALLAGMASSTPIAIDTSGEIVFEPDEMCILTSEDYEEILNERERVANNQFRSALAEEMDKIAIEDYVNDMIMERYIGRNESGKFGHEYIIWRNSGSNSGGSSSGGDNGGGDDGGGRDVEEN